VVSVLEIFEQTDLLTPILRLTASSDARVTKQVARDAWAVAPAVRRLIWSDLIFKGRAILKGHTSVVKSCAFSPNGKRIATVSWDKTARL
jgi:WD40 repeat protein